eukprot:177663-Pleurochrysis_carterae.AAC.1
MGTTCVIPLRLCAFSTRTCAAATGDLVEQNGADHIYNRRASSAIVSAKYALRVAFVDDVTTHDALEYTKPVTCHYTLRYLPNTLQEFRLRFSAKLPRLVPTAHRNVERTDVLQVDAARWALILMTYDCDGRQTMSVSWLPAESALLLSKAFNSTQRDWARFDKEESFVFPAVTHWHRLVPYRRTTLYKCE